MSDTTKKRAPKDCCPLMGFVLKRCHERTMQRVGLTRETFFSVTGKAKPRDSVVLSFPKAKNRREDGAASTYAEVNFCPFCGKQLRKIAS